MKFSPVYLIIVISLLKFYSSMQIGLIPDEAYYWEWSRHLDLSYYDQGPGIAYFIKFFTSLFGDTHFALRLGSAVSSFLSIILIYLVSIRLNYSNRERLWVVLFILMIPAFFAGSIFILHDSVLLLFWSLGIFATVSFLKSRKPIFIYILFLSLALGTLSKHTMVFFAISLIVWFIITKEEWSLLRNFHFYIGLGLAFLMICPVLYWNFHQDWENIDAIVNLRSSGGSNFKKTTTASYFIKQMISFSPIWFLAGFYLLFQTVKNRMINKSFWFDDSCSKFIFVNAMILPIFFLILSLQKEIQANWVFASYLSIILILAKEMGSDNKIFKSLIYFGLLISFSMNVFTFEAHSITKMLGIKLDSYFIPSLRHKGFQEIVDILEIEKTKIDPNSITIANRYQDAAILSWYSPKKTFVTSMNILQKNQYNRWNGLERGKNYFLVHIQENTCEKSFVFYQPYLKFMFSEVIEYPEKEIVYEGNVLKRYQFWYLRDYKRSWANPVSDFLSKRMIVELMPNLKGFEPYELKEKMNDEGIGILMNYLEKKGETQCSIF